MSAGPPIRLPTLLFAGPLRFGRPARPWRALGACVLLAGGCGKDDGPSAEPGPADAGADAGVDCPASGVSKGPWSLHVDRTSAVVRWEACRAGTSAALRLTAGSESRDVVAEARDFVVNNTYVAAFSLTVPPDRAGTYVMHEARVDGLRAGTCYEYSLDQDATAQGRFCTAREPGEPFRFLAIADTNPGLATHTVDLLPHLVQQDFDFTIHGGDIQYYASGLETWASWFPAMAPMLRQGAFLPSIGNHEAEKDDELEQYFLRFFGGAGFDGTDAHYRFESGGVWFFALDSETDFAPGSAQLAWFEQRVADAAAQPGYRFSVAYLHRPLLTCGDVSQPDSTRAALQPVFEEHGVALVVQGHMHGYERFEVPLESDPTRSMTYLTAAGGGGALGDVNANSDRATCGWRKAAADKFHGVVLSVDSAGISGQAILEDGSVEDEFSQSTP
jgi:hypothetical protein